MKQLDLSQLLYLSSSRILPSCVFRIFWMASLSPGRIPFGRQECSELRWRTLCCILAMTDVPHPLFVRELVTNIPKATQDEKIYFLARPKEPP